MGNTVSAIKGFWGELAKFLIKHVPDPFPARAELAGYHRGMLMPDARAGLNVALLAFPQGLAYAVIAGLPIAYGVTCSAVASLVAPVFASSRLTILGPTNATAFMLFSYFAAFPGQFQLHWIPLIVLTVGVILIVGSMLRMADLVQYISRSVMIGYITGASLLIIVNQARHVVGVSFPVVEAGEAAPRTFFGVALQTLKLLPSAHLPTVAISALTLVVFLGLSWKLKKLPVFAITLVLMSLVAWWMNGRGMEVATYQGEAFGAFDQDTGEFAPQNLLPEAPRWNHPNLFSKWSGFFGLSLGIAFLAAMENSVMAQTLGSRTGNRPDKNQDMFSVGVANIACGFLSGMPASGSLTRSALNHASGAASRISSVFGGLLLVGAALTLGGFVKYIPKAALAMLVVAVAGSLINRRNIRVALRATHSDAVVVIATFLAALMLPLDSAIFLGVGISVALYLRKASRPYLVEYDFNDGGHLAAVGEVGEESEKRRSNPAISIVHVEGELFFGAAELFRSQIQLTCNDPNLRIIVLRMKNARHLDATSVLALDELITYLRSTGRDLIVSGAMKAVYRVLKNAGMVEVIGRDNIFLGAAENPNLSTRNALMRAKEILGGEKADVRIFFDPNKDTSKSG